MPSKEYILKSFGRKVKFFDDKDQEVFGEVVGYDPQPRRKNPGNWFIVKREDNGEWEPAAEVVFLDDHVRPG